ncbi:MAG: exodeoxyribonuclease VII small subunit [Phycisphaerales bacterium]|nr:exodeoxyribonuclease VII small subunit [Phycisphaerales bacterium]
MSKRPGKHGDGTELSFEESLAQLEAIVEKIEGGEVGLESALEEYERGVSLLKRCRDVLDRAEQKVEELSAKAGERGKEEEADGEEDAAPF